MPAIKKDLRQLARTYTKAAVLTLAGIMKQPKAQASARIAAATALLDRGWGKAPQQVNIDATFTLIELLTGPGLIDQASEAEAEEMEALPPPVRH